MAPQPSSLALTPDDNLLVAYSPDEAPGDAAVAEYDMSDQQPVSLSISSIDTPAGLALVPPNVAMAVSAANWVDAGSKGLTVVSTAANGMLNVENTGNGSAAISPQSAAGVGEVQITGPDNAANTLTIDFSGGSPIPPDGIFFDGASGATTNTVAIQDPAGSNAYGLNGAQLTLNGVPAITMTNTQALSLDLGSGSLGLGGEYQAIGSINFVQGSITHGTLSSGLFTIQSGTIGATWRGPVNW